MARRKKSHHFKHEEPEAEEGWLVAYADLMTLLFGFFVIISAFSTPDVEKLEALKESTAESMGGEYVQPFNELSTSLEDILVELNVKKDVTFEVASDGVIIRAGSKSFFDSGSTQLKEQAVKVLEKIGKTLSTKAKGFLIVVEGHTDDTPMNGRVIPSNWELSAFRASVVVRLFIKLGLPHNNLRAIGMADSIPAISVEGLKGQELSEARAINRRIIIRVQQQLPKRIDKANDKTKKRVSEQSLKNNFAS